MNQIYINEEVSLRDALAHLGFRPALLDYATMRIHVSLQGIAEARQLTLVPGFERNGYFYTRGAAERAAREWI